MKIYLFCEGDTERNIIEQLRATLNFEVANPEKPKKQGKDQIIPQMTSTLSFIGGKQSPVRALIMRDVDAGETEASIVEKDTKAVQEMLKKRDYSERIEFQPHPTHANVYTLALSNPDLRLALHLATHKWKPEFKNATMDDYVLELALRHTTLATLLESKKWTTTPEQIIRKVTIHIPALLKENNIPVREAKDYLRLYAALLQEHTTPATIAKNTMKAANDADKREILAPLFAAIDFLGGA